MINKEGINHIAKSPEKTAGAIITDELSLILDLFLQQGVEPEEFPLLLQSLKTDSLVSDFSHTTNKKLYRGKCVVLCL